MFSAAKSARVCEKRDFFKSLKILRESKFITRLQFVALFKAMCLLIVAFPNYIHLLKKLKIPNPNQLAIPSMFSADLGG